MESLQISFCHHLSLSYAAGGEKWLIQLAKELVKRGHDVEIYSLPFLLDGKPKVVPKELLEGIPYEETLRKKVKADICYVTYNPLSWLNFETPHPRIAGLHSHTYWLNPHPSYGKLPNIANIVNRFTSYFELRRFDAIHTVSSVYAINHPRVYYIPNFVDSERFKPCEKDQDFSVVFVSRTVWQKGWDTFRKVKDLADSDIMFKISHGQIPENDLPEFLGQSHVTLVPSRRDTFGISIVESLMCETPVITTPLVTHKALDLPLLYATHPREFVLEINRFREMDDYTEFARNCRREALKYDKQKIIDKIELMFKEVVANV